MEFTSEKSLLKQYVVTLVAFLDRVLKGIFSFYGIHYKDICRDESGKQLSFDKWNRNMCCNVFQMPDLTRDIPLKYYAPSANKHSPLPAVVTIELLWHLNFGYVFVCINSSLSFLLHCSYVTHTCKCSSKSYRELLRLLIRFFLKHSLLSVTTLCHQDFFQMVKKHTLFCHYMHTHAQIKQHLDRIYRIMSPVNRKQNPTIVYEPPKQLLCESMQLFIDDMSFFYTLMRFEPAAVNIASNPCFFM